MRKLLVRSRRLIFSDVYILSFTCEKYDIIERYEELVL